MKKKIYTSYSEIDDDLEILNLERRIAWNRMSLNVEQTKVAMNEKLKPLNFVRSAIGFAGPGFTNFSSNRFIRLVLPIVIGLIFKRKRGH